MAITPELQQEMGVLEAFRTKDIATIKKAVNEDKKLTIKQKLFACNYLDNWGNAADAIRKAGYNLWSQGGKDITNIATVLWSENLAKPNIKKYLDDFGDLAGSKIVHIMNNWKEDNQLKSAQYVYDQVHWKATQKIEQSVTFSLSSLSPAKQADYSEINIIDVEESTLHNIDYAMLEALNDNDIWL